MSGPPAVAPLLQRLAGEATVAVVGLGYVGLPSALQFAAAGFKVIGVDIRPDAVDAVNAGRSPIPDSVPHAEVAAHVRSGRLWATLSGREAAAASDAIAIAVPTPLAAGGQLPHMDHVVAAGRELAAGLRKGTLVVLESTVYPGATEAILRPALESSGLRAGTDFMLAHCPERVNPGDPSKNVGHIDRVTGGLDAASTAAAVALYTRATPKGRIHPLSSLAAAETVKTYENTQRDVAIALANELALFCEAAGLDAWEVIDGAATKWNFMKVYPGAGVGGDCLPVNPWYLQSKAKEVGSPFTLIPAARAVNLEMARHVADLVENGLRAQGRSMAGARVAALGLSYKENLADCRLSPSLDVLRFLKERGADCRVVDPVVPAATAQRLGWTLQPLADACQDADVVVLLTAHAAFRKLDWAQAGKLMRTRVAVDGRHAWDRAAATAAGFTLRTVGRSG